MGEQTVESERDARDLDDVADREELRSRYYGLLQELRVVLPGVQPLGRALARRREAEPTSTVSPKGGF